MKNWIISSIVLACLTLSALAAPESYTVYAGGGTDVGNTISYAVVSARSENGGAPVVTYVSATSDKSGSVVQFYSVDTNQVATTASTATVYLPVSATNGFASGDIIVIRHMTSDTYEKRILTAFNTNGVLILTAAPGTATAVGDLIYKVTAGGTIPVGAATATLYGEGIYAGQKGKPLLLEVDGTSACQLNAVCAKYVK